MHAGARTHARTHAHTHVCTHVCMHTGLSPHWARSARQLRQADVVHWIEDAVVLPMLRDVRTHLEEGAVDLAQGAALMCVIPMPL